MPCNAIVLAAGMGTRLKDLTQATPKALISVSGKPLIDYALAFAQKAGARSRLVVGGFCHQDVAARVKQVAPDALLIENKEFRKGNLISMQTGLDQFLTWSTAEKADGFWLMNTDHIYKPSIAEVVMQTWSTASEVTAFCDFDRKLGNDDMKVELDAENRVVTMSKKLETYQAGYVGMTFVPIGQVERYRQAAADVLAKHGDASHAEMVLVELASHGLKPKIADISGHGWLEVDEPHERDHAEAVLAEQAWWG